MAYFMYLRKSRADVEAETRGEQETLSRHRAMLMQLAVRNGHTIARVYAELVSGETIAARPEMQRLLADIASGGCDGVYVMEIERLARGDTMDQGRVAQAFLYSRTMIITPAKTYDPQNEFDQEYFEFGLYMARREYKTINRRIQAGRLQSVREGKYICSRPAYGYRKVKLEGAKGYTLAVEPDEAAVVRQIYRWYLEGEGLTRIAGRLQDMRIPPGAEGKGWTACRVQRMLTNEVYIGMIRWGRVKTERSVGADGVHKRLRQSRNYELVKGLHEAIIAPETFEAVQAALAGRHVPMRRDMEQSNPLAGILCCGVCGHYMRGVPASGRQPARVKCAQRGCPTVQNYRAPVEEAILDALRGWLADYRAHLDPFAHLAPSHDQTEAAVLRAALEAQRRDAEELVRQKNALHDLLERGVYDEATFRERFAVLQERIKSADAAVAALRGKLANCVSYCSIEELAPAIEHVLDAYPSSTPLQQSQLLKAAISVVSYTKSQKGRIVRGTTYYDPNGFSVDVFPSVKR